MKIADDHLFYGSAIIQVAEDESFTAINRFQSERVDSQCAYWVNQDIGLYLKYRTEPNFEAMIDDKNAKVYIFVFNSETRRVIDEMANRSDRVFLGLVCVEDRQICCVSLAEYKDLLRRRFEALGEEDEQFRIQVGFTSGGKFRVYVTTPKRKGVPLGRVLRIAQSDFPSKVFR